MSYDGMIAVWFSCGAASAVAAKRAVELYGDQVRVVNNPVIEEDNQDSTSFRNRRLSLVVLKRRHQPIGIMCERLTPKYSNNVVCSLEKLGLSWLS